MGDLSSRDNLNDVQKRIRVVVGMDVCGISSGSRPVLNAFLRAASEGIIPQVEVSQSGCQGLCQFEPTVEVFEEGKDRVIYGKMTPDRVRDVIEKHLLGGEVIRDYTVAAYNK